MCHFNEIGEKHFFFYIFEKYRQYFINKSLELNKENEICFTYKYIRIETIKSIKNQRNR